MHPSNNSMGGGGEGAGGTSAMASTSTGIKSMLTMVPGSYSSLGPKGGRQTLQAPTALSNNNNHNSNSDQQQLLLPQQQKQKPFVPSHQHSGSGSSFNTLFSPGEPPSASSLTGKGTNGTPFNYTNNNLSSSVHSNNTNAAGNGFNGTSSVGRRGNGYNHPNRQSLKAPMMNWPMNLDQLQSMAALGADEEDSDFDRSFDRGNKV